MPVTVVSTPDRYALTKGGRMSFTFSGSGRLITTGSSAISLLELSGPLAEGTVINLRWNGRTEKLVVRDNPVQPNEIPSGDGSADYAISLEPFFKEYFSFREDFTCHAAIMGAVRTIVFTALRPGKAFSISGTTTSSNCKITQSNEGSDPQYRTQYSIYTEIWVQKAGTDGTQDAHFERLGNGYPIETDEDGLARIDVGSILHSQLQPDWPTWGFLNPSGSFNSQRKYFVAYGEAWGQPLQIGRMQKSEIRTAYLGGADYVHKADAGFDLQLFVQRDSPADDKALRFGSKTRYVRPDEPQFLTFLNTRATVEGLQLDVFRKFDDGSTDTISPYADQTWPLGAKITFAVGPGHLDVFDNIPGGKRLVEYYVKIKTSDADYSEPYRFIIWYRHEPYRRYFVYQNSLGVVETLVTWGKGSSELQRFYEQAERYLPVGYQVQDGQFVDYDITLQQQVEVTSGFRRLDELKLFNDFYRSPWRLLLRNGRQLPISIVSKSIRQLKDGDTLFSHKFEFVEQLRNEFYTEEDEEPGDALPPQGFTPAGNITIEQPTVVQSRDNTVPDILRSVTTAEFNNIRAKAAIPDHRNEGYLKQGTADQLYGKIYTPDSAVTTEEIGLQNLKTYNSATKKDELATAEQVKDFLKYGFDETLLNNPVAQRDAVFLKANVVFQADELQRGIFFANEDGSQIVGYMMMRDDGSIAIGSNPKGLAIALEDDGFKINGEKPYTRVFPPPPDTYDAVVKAGRETGEEVISGLYSHRSLRILNGKAQLIAITYYDSISKTWPIVFKTPRTFVREDIQPELDIVDLKKKLDALDKPDEPEEDEWEWEELRCWDAPDVITNTWKLQPPGGIVHDQLYDIPFGDYTKLYITAYNQDGTRNDAIGWKINEQPFKLRAIVPPNLNPFPGKLFFQIHES
ncbi:hypothetical protein DYU11_20975 [Fibrisoma montanum]|uniref:Uncharacterized protein n=1 Tax=Fibrisoma montanum TaxID=2305895 RepID=A0A418M451_9BACT|nr:hypothetical protein [Fibrisoma montanum]RIV20521.1 hypothetical protein DYU11_20975 [Fibrisoma montanum]